LTATQAATQIDHRLVKALGHPMRVRILATLNERVASPSELAEEFDEGLSQLSYHIKVLKDLECIELVETQPRRGAVEHFYRAMARAHLGNPEWREVPESLRGGVSAVVLQTFMDRAVEALKAGTLDARDDSYLTWTPMVVDEDGWGEIASMMAEMLDRGFEIQAKSAERLAAAGEEGTNVTVGLASFESPAEKSSS
jgi:DNA-binding transcriptional ArsR family regulator